MDYRSPTAGLERRLGELESELGRLRALRPVARRPRPRKSREERVLEARLAKLESALSKAGYRELTERERSHLTWCVRVGAVLVACGLLVGSAHVALRSATAMTWTRATCSVVEEEENLPVARYVSHGRRWQFSASGRDAQPTIACWVPEPPQGGLGRLREPVVARVSLWEKVSASWLGSAALAVLLGVVCMFGARREAENRRRNLIARDDFSSAD